MFVAKYDEAPTSPTPATCHSIFDCCGAFRVLPSCGACPVTPLQQGTQALVVVEIAPAEPQGLMVAVMEALHRGNQEVGAQPGILDGEDFA